MAEDGGVRVGLAVDVVLFRERREVLSILVIERAKEPFRDCVALPGGFVESGEGARDAAVRELREETGIAVRAAELVRSGRYGAPGRDPRGRVVSEVYCGRVVDPGEAVPASDARTVAWLPLVEFFRNGTRVAFDHRAMVEDAAVRMFGRSSTTWRGEGSAGSPGAAGWRVHVGTASPVCPPAAGCAHPPVPGSPRSR